MLPFRRESRRVVYLILVGAILEILSEMCQEVIKTLSSCALDDAQETANNVEK